MVLVTKRNVFPRLVAGHVNSDSLLKKFINHWGSPYPCFPTQILPPFLIPAPLIAKCHGLPF